MNSVHQNIQTPDEIKNKTIASIRRMKDFVEAEARKQEEAEKNNSIYVPAEAPFLFVVRIRSANKCSPDVSTALDCLRLRNINTGTFVINNKSSKSLLQKVRAYVAFGNLSLETIRKLIYTRAFGKYNGKRVNITQELLEEKFGGSVETLEDIVEALFLGKRQDASAINKWLWPFRLSCPRKGFGGRKIKDFTEGGATGDRGRYLDELITRMI
ncbi:large subunit ribosomal protein L7e [Nematocida minor]|uniref:large subunit ribosomal protein L7e n=1 Tax=Nematocida minor TaxID=1912983 RepID=UPI00221FD07B|nr:large subunit ribosomal protein L7e [Nematocida minor]KAI5189113.1 large subunit ribosomal protein L7e [Nematocida minor]